MEGLSLVGLSLVQKSTAPHMTAMMLVKPNLAREGLSIFRHSMGYHSLEREQNG